ncbi:MAG: hypothetical protein BWY81_00057 [Firmicutes bacterium ADurb.Bin467]|nr:MAG: hypothetical protein BWY81_00057 [Firmicutes bacterium ADurb.Bin467]
MTTSPDMPTRLMFSLGRPTWRTPDAEMSMTMPAAASPMWKPTPESTYISRWLLNDPQWLVCEDAMPVRRVCGYWLTVPLNLSASIVTFAPYTFVPP